MKGDSDLEELSKDMANDCVDAEFRDTMLDTLLAASHRQVIRRRATRAVATMAIVVGVVLSGWLVTHDQASVDSTLVADKSSSSVNSSETLETIPGTDIRVINDEELFALFPDRPLALVRKDGETSLVFLDERDR